MARVTAKAATRGAIGAQPGGSPGLVEVSGAGLTSINIRISRVVFARRAATGQNAASLPPSKMDWNNDQLYDTLPATQAFAKDLADVVKRIPSLDPRPYPLRLFM